MMIRDFRKWHEQNPEQLGRLNLRITKIYMNKNKSIVYSGEHPNYSFSYTIRDTGSVEMNVKRISDGETAFDLSLMVTKRIDPQLVMDLFLAFFKEQ